MLLEGQEIRRDWNMMSTSDLNLLGENIYAIKRNTGKEVGLEVNTEKT
jgi:hypothetical protein